MAEFGVPFPNAEDSKRACRAALGMLNALKFINRDRVSKQQEPISIGIGIHTGEAISGNIGSPKRFEYTVKNNHFCFVYFISISFFFLSLFVSFFLFQNKKKT